MTRLNRVDSRNNQQTFGDKADRKPNSLVINSKVTSFTPDDHPMTPLVYDEQPQPAAAQTTQNAILRALEKKQRDLDMIKQKRIQTLDDLVTTKSRSLSNQMRNTMTHQ